MDGRTEMKDIEITEEMIKAGRDTFTHQTQHDIYAVTLELIYKAMDKFRPSPWKKIKDLVIDESKESQVFFHRHVVCDKYCYSSFVVNTKDMFVYFNTPGKYDLAEFIADNPYDEYMEIPE